MGIELVGCTPIEPPGGAPEAGPGAGVAENDNVSSTPVRVPIPLFVSDHFGILATFAFDQA